MRAVPARSAGTSPADVVGPGELGGEVDPRLRMSAAFTELTRA
ncbi:hypothetical protein [Frankia tisae]|nr:hypothetical protein [Frankia tisae]